MREPAGVNDDGLNPFFFCCMNTIDQLAFVITLKTVQGRSCCLGLGACLLLDFRQRRRSVDLRLAGA